MQTLQGESPLPEELDIVKPPIDSVCDELTLLEIKSEYVEEEKQSVNFSDDVSEIPNKISPSMVVDSAHQNHTTSSLHSRNFRE